MSFLLGMTAIENYTEKKLDLNKELKIAGSANVVSGFFGGLVGFHSISQSILVHKLKANNRMVGVVAALVSLFILMIGSGSIGYFPRPVASGLLLYLGFTLLKDWGRDKFITLAFSEKIQACITFIGIIVLGLLPGIVLGLLVSLLFFAFTTKTVNPFSRKNCRLDYSFHQLATEHVHEISGKLHFANSDRWYQIVAEKAMQTGNQKPFVIDMKNVSYVDSSFVRKLDALNTQLRRENIDLQLRNVPLWFPITRTLSNLSVSSNSLMN